MVSPSHPVNDILEQKGYKYTEVEKIHNMLKKRRIYSTLKYAEAEKDIFQFILY